MHLSGGECYPDDGAGGTAHRPNGSDLSFTGLPIRRGGLRGMPPAVPVRGGKTGHGTNGATAPAGSAVTAGPRPAAERGLCRVPAAPRGSGAPAGAAVQLGIRQSRYFGRIKTRFQLYLAATVANLTLVAAKADMTGETGSGPSAGSAQAAGMVNSATAWLGQILTLSLLVSALLTKSLFPRGGFRPSF